MSRLLAVSVLVAALVASVVPAGAHTGDRPPDARRGGVAAPASTIAALPAPVVAATPAVPVARPPSVPARTDGAPAVALGVALLVVGAAIRVTGRRPLAVILALAVTLVAADAAVHSVHHVNDVRSAAQCPLALCFAQTPVVASATADVAGPEMAADRAIDRPALRIDLATDRPDRGRAPPTLSA